MSDKRAPLPGAVITEPGSGARYQTGSWRRLRPLYRNQIPPCSAACEAGIDVQKFLDLAKQGLYEQAWRVITESNPLPSVCGRVCYRPCETACSRGSFDEAVGVRGVERFIGDYGIREGLKAERDPALLRPSSFRAAVVGSGPAGLSCAYQLARRGHRVTVFEALPEAGGMLAVGIPPYRLPRGILERDLDFIRAQGVEIRTRAPVRALHELKEFDAVFLAAGALKSAPLGVPGEEAAGVRPGLDFLRSLSLGENGSLGRRVVVVGGGNTALDCSRTALRLGACVTLLYRRSRSEMPASPEEISEALAEGVSMRFLAAPKSIVVREGRVAGIECLEMRLGEPDSSGRRRPVPVEGSEFTIETDEVIAAVGQACDLGNLGGDIDLKGGFIRIDSAGRTSLKGIFAGGDAAAGIPQRVASAIGSGKRAAIAIDGYLRGENPPKLPGARSIKPGEMRFERFERFPRSSAPARLPISESLRGSAEVNGGWDAGESGKEAGRCLSCGVCNSCDDCWLFCPDSAVRRIPGGRYEIDLEHCKGCGICAGECPRGAVAMVTEG